MLIWIEESCAPRPFLDTKKHTSYDASLNICQAIQSLDWFSDLPELRIASALRLWAIHKVEASGQTLGPLEAWRKAEAKNKALVSRLLYMLSLH